MTLIQEINDVFNKADCTKKDTLWYDSITTLKDEIMDRIRINK